MAVPTHGPVPETTSRDHKRKDTVADGVKPCSWHCVAADEFDIWHSPVRRRPLETVRQVLWHFRDGVLKATLSDSSCQWERYSFIRKGRYLKAETIYIYIYIYMGVCVCVCVWRLKIKWQVSLGGHVSVSHFYVSPQPLCFASRLPLVKKMLYNISLFTVTRLNRLT